MNSLVWLFTQREILQWGRCRLLALGFLTSETPLNEIVYVNRNAWPGEIQSDSIQSPRTTSMRQEARVGLTTINRWTARPVASRSCPLPLE